MKSTLGRVGGLAGMALLALSTGAFAAPPEKGSKTPTYACVGFDEPIRNDMQVAKGRVLPLRAKLAMEGGAFADMNVVKAPPKVRVFFVPESGAEVDRTDQIDVRDYGKGTSFVWDAEAHWKFDLGTLKFTDMGKYRAVLLPGDEAEYKVDPTCQVSFALR
ncbi:MAG TPA: hypothetical protein VF376_07145 [Thermoanaerobaculia bacterium]